MVAVADFLGLASRLPFFLGLWKRYPFGSLESRIEYGIFNYPNYAYGVYWASILASRLRIPRITVVELGVAGGRGLVALERASLEIEEKLGVKIDVIGFDSGKGMPAPTDYRDLPHIWSEGFYRMDPEKLRSKLTRAQLILGDVRQTIPDWMENQQTSPIGFVSFDLDYYSSTKFAFRLFEGPDLSHLPRVLCYFDDLAGNNLACMNEFVGEHLAIREFNEEHPDRKICKIEQFRLARPRWEKWQERIYAFHNFVHADYNRLVIPKESDEAQLPLQ